VRLYDDLLTEEPRDEGEYGVLGVVDMNDVDISLEHIDTRQERMEQRPDVPHRNGGQVDELDTLICLRAFLIGVTPTVDEHTVTPGRKPQGDLLDHAIHTTIDGRYPPEAHESHRKWSSSQAV
jgi:hypothetical protein